MNARMRSRRLIGTVMSIATVANPLPLSAAWYFNAPTVGQQVTTTQDIACGGYTDHSNTAFTLICYDSTGWPEKIENGVSVTMYWSKTLQAPPWTADTTGTYHKVEVDGGAAGGKSDRQVKINP